MKKTTKKPVKKIVAKKPAVKKPAKKVVKKVAKKPAPKVVAAPKKPLAGHVRLGETVIWNPHTQSQGGEISQQGDYTKKDGITVWTPKTKE